MDQNGRSADQEFAIIGLNRRSQLLRNIEAALRRIEDGSFGICANCDEAIGRRRLLAIPWTPFCILCQETVDRGGSRNIEPSYARHTNAA